MTTADRYPPTSRRRRSGRHGDGDTLVISRAQVLDLVRAQTVTLNVFRSWAGLRPVGGSGGEDADALDRTGPPAVE